LTWLQLYHFNRRVDMLWRRNRGDTFDSIAKAWDVSRQQAISSIKRAKRDPKVVEAAEKMRVERQGLEELKAEGGYVPTQVPVRRDDPDEG